jgi:hypothetical protein
MFWYMESISFISKSFLHIFSNVKKFKIKNCIYMLTKLFHEKSTCCVTCVKKQISVLKIKLFTR